MLSNSVESVWALLRREFHGAYHHFSKKHLGHYADEFVFRLNEGNVEQHSLDGVSALFDMEVGKRLSYGELVA